MAKIDVHAGDFAKGKESQFLNGIFLLATGERGFWGPKFDKIPASDLAEINPASEENVKRMGGTVGWGVAGAVILGPIGLLAGLLAGGRGKDVTFVAMFKDGRKVLATTDSKSYTKMQASIF